jgi:hypothetical protein
LGILHQIDENEAQSQFSITILCNTNNTICNYLNLFADTAVVSIHMLSCFSFNLFTTDYLYKQITNNKLMFPKKTEHPFLHPMASCLETGMATIPKINTNIYSVPRIIVFKIQRDPSASILSYCKEIILSTAG